MSYATVEIYGEFALIAPELISDIVSKLVVSNQNTSFDFKEIAKGHGYFFPTTQLCFEILLPTTQQKVTINKDEYGAVVTLIFLGTLKAMDISSLNELNKAKAIQDKIRIQEQIDFLVQYSSENLNKDVMQKIFGR